MKKKYFEYLFKKKYLEPEQRNLCSSESLAIFSLSECALATLYCTMKTTRKMSNRQINIIESNAPKTEKNKAEYTATEVACGWAGAVMKKRLTKQQCKN